MKEIKGKKIEMSQVFDEKGRVVPVTLVKVDDWSEKLKPQTPVTVVGTSKGKGFAGVMKRWGFAGQQATHGQSDRQRAPGSIGGTTTPGRVYKGKKMPGRMGGQRTTVKGLKIVEADKELKTVKVSGAVPGARNSEVILKIA
jgi:large subunit ribosomal protein L3